MIKDFRGWLYKLLEIRSENTLLECLTTGDRVVIRNNGWDDLGFTKP